MVGLVFVLKKLHTPPHTFSDISLVVDISQIEAACDINYHNHLYADNCVLSLGVNLDKQQFINSGHCHAQVM